MENLFSSSWYSVSGLKPKLRQHVDVSSHKFRGNTWYLYQDTISGRTHQFSPIAHFFISMMDGKRTIQKIWDAMNTQFGDDSPNQEKIIQLLAQLHFADIIKTNVTPAVDELFQRSSQHKKSDWKKKFSNPISLRFSLLDPESLLNVAQPWFSWMFTKFFGLFSLCVLVLASLNAMSHWDSLTSFASNHALSYNNLLLLWLTYPVVKLIHEFGHAVATKQWGGEVHDMGVMLLYFTPIPYVDASAATAYRNKYKRVVVSAAGIIVELLLASLALLIWLNVEAGVIKDIAFNVMVIGGISTILFNGNPLLRYDAYYILSDMTGISNLGNRSNKYIGYLILRNIFGVKDAINPVKSKGECFWFFNYAIASFFYRMFILFFIVLFISNQYFFVGIALGIWVVILQLVIPLAKNIAFVITDSRVKNHQFRAMMTTIGFLALSYHFIFNVPVPYATVAEGVVWMDENTQIRTNNDGFISELHFNQAETVKKNSLLITTNDPLLESEVIALESKLAQLELEYRSEWNNDRIKRKIIEDQMDSVKSEIHHVAVRAESLLIRSPSDGKIVISKPEDLVGRFLEKGSLLGYVLNDSQLTARVMVTQDDMNLIKETDIVGIRFVNNMSQKYIAERIQIRPSATDKLPTAVLGVNGGGIIKIDPKDSSGIRSLDKYFEIWVTLPSIKEEILVGSRVYIKFKHGEEPIIQRFERWIDQLLLSQFNV